MTAKPRSELKTENISEFPDNTVGDITAADLRGQLDDIIDSALFPGDPGTGGGVSDIPFGPAWDGVVDVAPSQSAVYDKIVTLGEGAAGDFFPPWAGASTWPVTTRMQQQVYLLDFIPEEWHEKIRLRTTNLNAIPDANTFDCSPAIEAAMASVTSPTGANYYAGGPEIHFPLGRCYFSRTIEMKKTMVFTGHPLGGRTAYHTDLMFKAGITGIVVNSLNTYNNSLDPPYWPPISSDPDMTTGGDASTIRGLHLVSLSNGAYDPTLDYAGITARHGIGHGIWCRSRANIQQCTIQSFPIHGLYVRAVAAGAVSASDTSAQADIGRSLFGNANNMFVQHVNALSNGGCGFYIDGPDTNAGNFIGCDAGSNRLSGFYDNSLIGNTHIGHHASDNCVDSLCSYQWGPTPATSAGIRGQGDGARYSVRNVPRANGLALPWVKSTAYSIGALVENDNGNLYICTVAGTSAASGGPKGLVGGIAIVDGSARWNYRADTDLFPLDAVARVPPEGHADSRKVWDWIENSTTLPEFYVLYPPFPYNGFDFTTTPMRYWRAHSYWMSEDSATRNILINPYWEGGPPQYIHPATLVLGSLNYSPDEPTGPGTSIGAAGRMQGKFFWPSLHRNEDLSPDFFTHINCREAESITWLHREDTPAGLSFAWSPTDKAWAFRWDVSTYPLRFTARDSTLTGGRTGPLTGGHVMFTFDGIWVGRAATVARQLSADTAVATTGEYAGGDIRFNASPTTTSAAGITSPTGWQCTLTGAVATVGWVADTTYQAGDLRGNGGNSYVCVTPGVSGGNPAWTTDADGVVYTEGQLRTNGGATYVCVDGGRSMYTTAWAPGAAMTPVGALRTNNGELYELTKVGSSGAYGAYVPNAHYDVGASVTNGGNYYVCVDAGTSGSPGPTGTDPINPVQSGTTLPTFWLYQPVQGPYTTVPPSGGAASMIPDGSCRWRWLATLPVATTGPSGGATGGPLADGKNIRDGGVLWNYVDPGVGTLPDTWANDTLYSLQQVVVNGAGDIYRNEIAGMSASNVPWTASTVYAVGDMRSNDTGPVKSYRVRAIVGDATSASSGGPTGTGTTDIVDNNVLWRYQSDTDGPNGATVNQVDGEARWGPITETADGGTGPTGTGTYIIDGGCVWTYKPPMVFTPFDGKLSQQTISDGLAFTLTAGSSPRYTQYTGTMTAIRAVSLPVPTGNSAVAGQWFKITRTATGAFALNVGTGPLRALAVNEWCEVTYNGSAWYLSAAGSL